MMYYEWLKYSPLPIHHRYESMNAHHLRKQLRQQRLCLSKRHRNHAAYQARRGLDRL